MKSAIVPYKGNSSSVAVKPQQSMAIVPAKKESVNKAEVTAKDIRRNVLMLLRKRQQRDRLEAKFAKVKEASKAKDAARKEESKQEKTSFLTKVGSGVKGKAEKLGGNLFGALGDLLGFIALDWISKPENQQTLKGIVEGIGHIFSFVDWWVTGSVDNLMTGFSQLVGGDTILERFVGFIKLVGGIFGLRYFANPTLIIKDFNRIKNFIMEGGVRKLKIFLQKTQKYGLKKGLKFAFPKLSKVLQKVGGLGKRVLGGIKNILGKTGVGNLFKRIGNAIWRQGGGKAAKFIMPVMKKLLKPVTGFLKKIPVVGGLISFGVNLLFGDSLTQAAFKALGSGLGSWIGGGIGTLIPIPFVGTFAGAVVGGIIGDWLGNRFYEMLMKREPSKVTAEEEMASKVRQAEARAKNGNPNITQEQVDAFVKKELKITDEQLDAAREFQRQSRGEGETDTTTTSGDTIVGDIPPAGSNAKALLNTIRYAEGTSGPQGYNTWFGGRTDMDLTSMTIDEVVAEQKRRLANGEATYGKYTSAAVGAYQMMKPEVFAIKAGFDPATTKFTPAVQDQMAIVGYMKGQAKMSQAEIDAHINKEQIAKMAPVWASLPMMDGRSRYGQPVKSFAELESVYNKSLGKGGGSPIPMQKQYRHSIMSQLSMEAVQARKFANRGGGGTVIIRTGAQTYANYTSVVNAPRVNSNTRMSQKRGL